MLQIEDVSFSYQRDREVLSHISVKVKAGQAKCLLGPNGVGKSTLIKLCTGQIISSTGSVRIGGAPAYSRQARLLMGYAPQFAAFPQMLTMRQVMTYVANNYLRPCDVEEAMCRFEIDHLADVRCSRLSWGQQRRIQLALAFMGDPTLIVLDEPTAGLDASGRQLLLNSLSQAATQGACVFWSTHIVDDLELVGGDCLVLKDGQVIADADVDSLLDRSLETWCVRWNDQLPRVFGASISRIGSVGFLAAPVVAHSSVRHAIDELCGSPLVLSVEPADLSCSYEALVGMREVWSPEVCHV